MSQLFDESQQFIDETTGELLVGGKLYIGTVSLDAKTNPISVYGNRALTGAAIAQPVILGADGRVSTKLWLSGKYSFIVDSSADVQKYSALDNGVDEQVGNTLLINSLGTNDVTVTGSPTVTTLVDNQTYIFTAPADNTGAMTLDIDTIGAKAIRKGHDQAMASGDIKASQKLVVVWNETDDWFEIQTGFTLIPTLVSGHVRAGNTQITDGKVAASFFAVQNVITAGTFETVGATGSGATNIFAGMDSLPATATILLVDVAMTMSQSGTDAGILEFYAKTDGLGSSDADAKLAILEVDADADISGDQKSLQRIMIPLDSNQLFSATWTTTNTDGVDIVSLTYKGFMTD